MGSILYGNAIHTREQSQIDAARVTRASGNEKRGALSALSSFSASLSNTRAMDAAGTQVNNITENIGRNLDAAATGTLMSRLAAAEELGAHTAMAAAAGVGGSSVELYGDTLRLNAAMQEEANQRSLDSDNIAASRSRGYVVSDAVAGFDNNRYFADLDYTINVDHHKQSTLGKLFTVGVAAAATYFGGPQAGMAVIGLNESRQAARNGDFATAASEATGALRNGISAAQDYRKTHGGGKPTDPAGDKWASTQKIMAGVHIKSPPPSSDIYGGPFNTPYSAPRRFR